MWPKWLQKNETQLVAEQEQELQDWLAGSNTYHNSVPRWEGTISKCRLARYQLDYLSSGSGDAEALGLISHLAMNSVVLKLGLTRAYPERSQLRIMQEEYGFILAHLIAVGWREEAELVARLGFQAGEETFMVSFPNHRIPWLMLKLTHDWLGAKVEPNGRLRPEDGLGPWQKTVRQLALRG